MSENEAFSTWDGYWARRERKESIKKHCSWGFCWGFQPMELISVLSTWIVISYGAACSIRAAGLRKMHRLQNGYFSVEPCTWIKESLP